MTHAETKEWTPRPWPPTDPDTRWYDLLDVAEPPEDGHQQEDLLMSIKAILMARYANDPSVLMVGPSVYLVQHSKRYGMFVAPDCCVIFGVDSKLIKRERLNYRIDEWGVPPSFVMEVGTQSTADEDLGVKREIYARMGAQEYWRLDWLGESYPEPLVGERLVSGEYVPFELHTEPDGAVWSRSEVLEVDFFCRVEEDEALFFLRDSVTGEWLNSLRDEKAAHAKTRAERQAAEARAAAAKARAAAAKAELERLRRQLDRQ